MPIADSYRVTERALEGRDMWWRVLKWVLRGAGASYLGLLFANLFITSIAAGITFGMVKVLRITWLFVALHMHLSGIILIWDVSLGLKVSLIAIKYSTSILSLTFIFLFKRLPASGVLNCSAEGLVILLPSVELFCTY
mgnify:FL=1